MRGLLVVVLVVGGIAGCGDAAVSNPDGAGGTMDLGSVDAADPTHITCGDPPYQNVDVRLTQAQADGTTPPLQVSATVRFDGCADPLITDSRGRGTARLSASMSPRAAKIEAAGFIPSLTPERAIVAGNVTITFTLFPTAFKPLFPGWDEQKAAVVLAAIPSATSGPCADKSGVSFRVVGHPELVPVYFKAGGIGVEAGATATTSFGIGVLSGITGGEKLEIRASKPECDAITLDAAGIGLNPTENGVLSIRGATLAPPAGVPCGPGPYATITGIVTERSISDYNMLTPLAGASITYESCPSAVITTAADGSYAVNATIGVPSMVLVHKTGYIDFHIGQYSFANSGSGFSYQMRSDAWRAVEPAWSDSAAPIYAAVLPLGTGPCSMPDGVSVAVHSHPEAVAHYLDTASPPAEVTNATATTLRGQVALTGLPVGTYTLDVTTSKACQVNTAKYYQTGTMTTQVNARNIMAVFLENP